MESKQISLKEVVISANTGADAIQRAPIVDYDTGKRCLRIGDISNNRGYEEWGFTNVNEANYKKYKLEKDDILIARTGSTIGINKFIKKDLDAVYNNGLIRLKINKEKYNSRYIYYILQSEKFKNFIASIAFGTTGQPNMKINDMLTFKILDIPLDRQNKIVDIINNFDEKIELNNKINKNLLNLSHQMYEKYFSKCNFEKEVKLSKLCNIKYGRGLPTKKILDKGYPVYGGNGIIGYYNEKMYEEPQILISCRGAASGKVIFTKPNCFVTNNSLVLESDRKYYYYLKELSLANPYYSYSTGSAQPQITSNLQNICLKVVKHQLMRMAKQDIKP